MITITPSELKLLAKITELKAAIQYGLDEISEMKTGIRTRRMIDIQSRLRKALK
jgi:hypothetical protein